MRAIVLFAFVLWASLLYAEGTEAHDLYQFDSAEQSERFENLSKQLRCLVCQNESLNDSQAPLANDFRNIIAEKIKAGHDDEAIVAFMVERYGNFVLFKPPLERSTGLLWFAPFLFLLFGMVAF